MVFPLCERLRELSEAREKRLKDEASRLGSAIRNAKREDAVNLKSLGVSFDIISKATGLSMEEIEKL